MAYSWESLNNLKGALGDVGEGVVSYLQGRKEDEARQQNWEALKQYHASLPPEQQVDPHLLGTAFAQNGFRAMPTIQAIKPQTQVVAGAAPGQYKTLTTPALGGQPQLGKLGGPGAAPPAPEEEEYDPDKGVPYGIDTAEKLAMYKGNMERLKGQIDTYNQTPEGKLTPKTFHPKLQAGLDAATSTMNVLNKQRAEQLAFALGNKKAFADYQTDVVNPKKNAQALDLYGQKLGLKQKSDVANLDPDMIEREGQKYYATGVMPALGMGNAPLRTAIMLRAAQIGKQEGETNPEAKQALYAGHQAAYKALVTQAGQIGAREKAAERNLDMALEVSKKYARGPMPAFNKFQNWYSEQVDNNPKYTELENAVYAASREYAKVASGSIGNAPLSDQSVKDVDKLLNTAQSPQQLEAAIGMMRRDLQNVPAGFEDQLKVQRDLLNTLGPRANVQPKATPPTAVPPTTKVAKRSRWNPQTQQLEEVK